MRPICGGVSLLFLWLAALYSQASAKLNFEVASVRPSARNSVETGERSGGGLVGGGCPTSLRVDRERVNIRCATMAMLIGYAYRISPDRVEGPDWMMRSGSPRFDVTAKFPQDAPRDQVPDMLQALLVNRFQLAFHRRNKSGAIYALAVEKGGLKLKGAAPDMGGQDPIAPSPDTPPGTDGFFGTVQTRKTVNADGRGSTTIIFNPQMGTVREMVSPFGMQRWEASHISLEGLADLLDKVAPLSSPVVNMTGRKGRFQMVLEVSLKDARAETVTSGSSAIGGLGMEIEEAVLKGFNDGLRKLGLKLVRRKGTVGVIVIDHAEKTSTEN